MRRRYIGGINEGPLLQLRYYKLRMLPDHYVCVARAAFVGASEVLICTLAGSVAHATVGGTKIVLCSSSFYNKLVLNRLTSPNDQLTKSGLDHYISRGV